MDRDGSGWLDPKKLQKALQFMYAEATHNTPQAQCDTVASSRERERERESERARERLLVVFVRKPMDCIYML